MHLTCVYISIFVHSSAAVYPLDLYYRNNTRVCLPVYPHATFPVSGGVIKSAGALATIYSSVMLMQY